MLTAVSRRGLNESIGGGVLSGPGNGLTHQPAAWTRSQGARAMDRYTAADTLELLRGYQAAKSGLEYIAWETPIWRAGWRFAHGLEV